MLHLAKRVLAHYADSTDDNDWPLRNLHWDYPEHGEHARAQRRGRPEGDQRLRGRDGEPLSGFARAQGRRLDRVRLLDLLRLLRRRRQPAAPARPRRHRRPRGGLVSPEWGWAWPANRRMLYNRASADPRASRGRSARSTSGGTRTRASGRATTCPTSRPTRRRLPRARRRRGHGRDLRRRPVHHDGRRPRLAVLAERPARRPAADALRAARVAVDNLLYPRSAPTRSALVWDRTATRSTAAATRATRSWRRPSG